MKTSNGEFPKSKPGGARPRTSPIQVVQNLRGSLGPHEVGIVVTSSGFSDEARKEAQGPTKAPIGLISGQQFAELLLKYEIGIQHIDRKLYRLVLDDLTKDKLQSRVKEPEGDV